MTHGEWVACLSLMHYNITRNECKECGELNQQVFFAIVFLCLISVCSIQMLDLRIVVYPGTCNTKEGLLYNKK